MGQIKEVETYDHTHDKIVTEFIQDETDVLEDNLVQRIATPETGKYKGNFIKAACITEIGLQIMRQRGYDLLAIDPEERRRALVYMQENMQQYMVIDGKPFARKRKKWA